MHENSEKFKENELYLGVHADGGIYLNWFSDRQGPDIGIELYTENLLNPEMVAFWEFLNDMEQSSRRKNCRNPKEIKSTHGSHLEKIGIYDRKEQQITDLGRELKEYLIEAHDEYIKAIKVCTEGLEELPIPTPIEGKNPTKLKIDDYKLFLGAYIDELMGTCDSKYNQNIALIPPKKRYAQMKQQTLNQQTEQDMEDPEEEQPDITDLKPTQITITNRTYPITYSTEADASKYNCTLEMKIGGAKYPIGVFNDVFKKLRLSPTTVAIMYAGIEYKKYDPTYKTDKDAIKEALNQIGFTDYNAEKTANTIISVIHFKKSDKNDTQKEEEEKYKKIKILTSQIGELTSDGQIIQEAIKDIFSREEIIITPNSDSNTEANIKLKIDQNTYKSVKRELSVIKNEKPFYH